MAVAVPIVIYIVIAIFTIWFCISGGCKARANNKLKLPEKNALVIFTCEPVNHQQAELQTIIHTNVYVYKQISYRLTCMSWTAGGSWRTKRNPKQLMQLYPKKKVRVMRTSIPEINPIHTEEAELVESYYKHFPTVREILSERLTRPLTHQTH